MNESSEKTSLSKMVEEICDNYCKFPYVCADEETLENVCQGCPMSKLMDCETNLVEVSHDKCPFGEEVEPANCKDCIRKWLESEVVKQ